MGLSRLLAMFDPEDSMLVVESEELMAATQLILEKLVWGVVTALMPANCDLDFPVGHSVLKIYSLYQCC